MPTLILVERERGITRDRPRMSAPGHFITVTRFATVYSLTYPRSDAAYVKWWPYRHPYPHPIGYVFEPPPWPPYIPIGTIYDPETVGTIGNPPPGFEPVVPGIPTIPGIPSVPSIPGIQPGLPAPTIPGITLPPLTPPQTPGTPTTSPPTLPKPPEGVTTTWPAAAPDFVGMKFYANVGVFTQVEALSTPIRSIVIVNDANNTSRILVRSLKMGKDGGMLHPGQGLRLDIDDASKVLVAAESAQALVHVWYELARVG